MTHKNDVLNFLIHDEGTLCDDCLSELTNIHPRQAIYQICSSLAAEGHIVRTVALCSACGRNKKTSRIATKDSGEAALDNTNITAHGSGEKQRPWYWEGNIQSKLAAWLAGRGYRIARVADTASRSRGVDIIAQDAQGKNLLVTVKGYPETSRYEQARHYFTGAVFDLILYRGESNSVQLGMGLPAGFATYVNLARKVQWMRAEILPFDIYWISEDGQVRKE